VTATAATPPRHATLTRPARRLPWPPREPHARTARLSRHAAPGGSRAPAASLRERCAPL